VIYHAPILCQALFPVSVEKVRFKTRKEEVRSEVESGAAVQPGFEKIESPNPMK
jgi:hypothetical protein